jgi:hypothetical protein
MGEIDATLSHHVANPFMDYFQYCPILNRDLLRVGVLYGFGATNINLEAYFKRLATAIIPRCI